ncbi:MAG: hypothetical protein H6733_14480 [Alphaproteobacteria bacterium]|nr:hypothetical protein [Alphaproteobacteria bacterium]
MQGWARSAWCVVGLMGGCPLARADEPVPAVGEEPGTVPSSVALPDHLGPARIAFGAHHSLTFGGAVQLQLGATFPIDGAVQGKAALRRVRVDLRASLQDGLAGFRLQLNLLPGAFELLDAVLTSEPHPRARVAFGFQKVPFTRYRQVSFTALPLVDWALTTRMFGAERQLGLVVQDAWQQGATYGVGVFAGTNSRASHAVGLAETYGVDLANPSDLRGPGYDLSVHPEVVARLGYASADVDARAPVDRIGGAPRWAVLVSGAVDARPTPQVDLAGRIAPELVLKVEHVSVSAVWYGGWFVDVDGAWRFGVHGALGEVTWRAHRFVEITARYAGVYRLSSLARDVADRGGSASEVGSDHEAGIGWSVPTLGDHFDWTTDVMWVGQRGAVPTDAVRVRSLIQVAL